MGRVGELALALYAMVSSDGELELFTPVSDEDHVDVTAGRRGAIPSIAIQVKAAPRPDPHGVVGANATFVAGRIREHPAFLYCVLLMDGAAIQTAWLVPSPDFNRLAYRIAKNGHEVLEFRAYPDRDDKWAAFRVPPIELGPRLLAVIDSLPERIPASLLDDQGGLVVGVRKKYETQLHS
jgi:hypothetical protein